MEEKLKFLKEYSMKNNPDIRIIAYNEMDTVPLNSIPELWGIIFREKEQNKRKNMIMDITFLRQGDQYKNEKNLI